MNNNIFSDKQISALDSVIEKIMQLPKVGTSKINGDCEKMKAYVKETSLKVRNESN